MLFALLLASADLPAPVREVIDARCAGCHAADGKGRLDLTALTFDPADGRNFARWAAVYDRVAAGEMPPKGKHLDPAERQQLTDGLGAALRAADATRSATDGRATRRRLSRREYECVLRDLLKLPWLRVADVLPEDGTAHHFAKSGDALDVSHVQMGRYLTAADAALRAALAPRAAAPDPTPVRHYARDQTSFTRKMTFSVFNTAPERATFPTLGFAGQPAVRAGTAPVTAGAADPTTRELEGVGLPCGAYEPVEPKFNQFKAPVAGRYKLRVCGQSAWLGPGGRNALNPKAAAQWFIPDLDAVTRGRRDEPVTLYAETPPRQMRHLGSFDLTPDPVVRELDVFLLAGETIRPDAARLFRSRPGEGRWHNPLAEADGQPAVVYRWLEVEGPISETWPPPSHHVLFGDLPVRSVETGVEVASADPAADARRLLAAFARRAYRRPLPDAELLRFVPLVDAELAAGRGFTEAMLTGYKAVLCSPEFLYRHERPGRLDDHALACRLALFLWNSTPDAELRTLAAAGTLHDPATLTAQTDRLLNDPRAGRFVDTFLDYWLDLRRMGANNPDAALYNDYYLDDLLADSALAEPRAFVAELLRADLPARHLVASDFAMLNERLAVHYGVPGVHGVAVRKVPLPAGSVRGGLLTMASVLSVTANGTTTSPVLRGAWVTDRLLGKPSPPPPPVAAVEPDVRGATTIREQLAKHRDQASCAACHSKIDPPGFALEAFDVMGGYRDTYRAVAADKGSRATGFGMDGQPFAFRAGKPVDAAGELPDGRHFADVRAFKALLLSDERQVARNLAGQLVVYATGAPVRFGDRPAVEAMLDGTKPGGYGVRGLVHAVVQSDLFGAK